MHFGGKQSTLLFTFLQCFFVLLVTVANSFPLFCAALLLYGFVASCMNINMNAHAVHIERLRKAPIMSSFHGFCSLGCMAGALLGSLAAQVALAPSVHLMIIAPLLMVVAYSVRTGLLAKEHTRAEPPTIEAAPKLSKPTLMVIAMCVIAMCSYVSEGAMGDWTTIYLHNELKSSEAFAALGFSIFSIAMCFGRFTGDVVIKRFGAATSVRASASLAVLGLATALLAQNATLALCAFGLVGLGLSIIVPTIYSTTAKRAANAGAAIALVSLFGYAGVLGGPPIIGFTAELTGLRVALSLICFMILTVVILAGQLSHAPESDTALFLANEVALDI
jgi:fucose permease